MSINSNDENKFNIVLDIWKEAQENQRHFNDILFKIRNLAFVFTGATVGIVGFILSKEPKLAGSLLIFASIPWLSLYFLDRYYYHILLIGAVRVARNIESEFMEAQNIPLLSTTVRDINHEYPIPLINAKTGKAKVTTFYAMPLIAALGVGVNLIFKNLLISLVVALLVGFVAFLLERNSTKKAKR